MKIILSILIVNYNSSEFVGMSLYALSKLTKSGYKVYIVDNNSKLKDYKKLKKIIQKYDNVYLERWETNLRGSLAHGTALNYLVKKVDTSYFSILDADAIWLKRNWDNMLINKIDKKTRIIGTQATGNKPKDFPLMYAILLETKTFKKLNIDFRARNISKLQDTGHELRKKYLNAGFSGEIIEFRSTRNYKEGPFNEVISAEYYLKGVNHIFACHFGRGSTLGINKYMNTRKKYLYKIPFLGKILLRSEGKKEKQKWIDICKKIVDEQTNEKD